MKNNLLAMEKYVMVIPTRPPALCAGKAPDEKLKMGPYYKSDTFISLVILTTVGVIT